MCKFRSIRSLRSATAAHGTDLRRNRKQYRDARFRHRSRLAAGVGRRTGLCGTHRSFGDRKPRHEYAGQHFDLRQSNAYHGRDAGCDCKRGECQRDVRRPAPAQECGSRRYLICGTLARSGLVRCRRLSTPPTPDQADGHRDSMIHCRHPGRQKTMPPLPREPNLFPPDLFNPEYLAQHAEREWWVLYTLARREKDLMRRLLASGAAFYCPVVAKRTRAPSGRVHVSHVPLFANYVFLYGDEMTRYRALTTRCVAQTLAVNDAAEMTRQLQQIERLIASGYDLQPHRHIESGERVRLRSG